MIVFYIQDLQTASPILEADEFHHCCKVLRHQIGDIIHVTDGKGTQATAELVDISKRLASVKVISTEFQTQPKTRIHLYVSPPKTRARWEWLVEKSVELGVNDLSALITQRTERSRLNKDRTEKIMRSAAMQSLRLYHPAFHGTISLTEVLNELPTETDKYLAHYKKGQPQLSELSSQNPSSIILIGPEGDFTPEEINQCNDMGFQCVNISEHRLRTETAAITAIALLKTLSY